MVLLLVFVPSMNSLLLGMSWTQYSDSFLMTKHDGNDGMSPLRLGYKRAGFSGVFACSPSGHSAQRGANRSVLGQLRAQARVARDSDLPTATRVRLEADSAPFSLKKSETLADTSNLSP